VALRQSVAAVVGTLFYALSLEGLTALPAIAGARPYIPVTQLHAWHGPFLYGVPPLIAAWILFRRRDVAT